VRRVACPVRRDPRRRRLRLRARAHRRGERAVARRRQAVPGRGAAGADRRARGLRSVGELVTGMRTGTAGRARPWRTCATTSCRR
jgi:hypothetical protein